MIRHAALFSLYHASGSPEEKRFLDGMAALSVIEGVKEFRVAKALPGHNPYAFEVSMLFDDEASYTNYMTHPDHMAFARAEWEPGVKAALENDTLL